MGPVLMRTFAGTHLPLELSARLAGLQTTDNNPQDGEINSDRLEPATDEGYDKELVYRLNPMLFCSRSY
jgi:hypothetical protein